MNRANFILTNSLQQIFKEQKPRGIKVGAYFFTQAITEQEAIEEADYAVSILNGIELDLPIAIDTEYPGTGFRHSNISAAQRTNVVKAFCDRIRELGYEPMIYAITNWFENDLIDSELTEYPHWVAQWNEECTYSGNVSIWQYTSQGSVSGIDGNADLNRLYLTVMYVGEE